MINWNKLESIRSRKYVCGHCGSDISSQHGYVGTQVVKPRKHGQAAEKPFLWHIYICHHCEKPTFLDQVGGQVPGPKPGADVSGITDEGVAALYDEARRCFGAHAFTACVLSCRKLLMHIAVFKGAATNLHFIEYVNYLSDNNYVPPGAKIWVDHIRNKGNEANHEILIHAEGRCS